MPSIHLLLNNTLPSASDLRRSFSGLNASFNGGRAIACVKVGVQGPDLGNSGKLGFRGTSKEVMEAEGRVMVGTYARAPVVISHGKGCKLYDAEGREYLDMAAGIAVNALGHGDPDWLKAVVDQANTLTHVSNIFYSIPQVILFYSLICIIYTGGSMISDVDWVFLFHGSWLLIRSYCNGFE